VEDPHPRKKRKPPSSTQKKNRKRLITACVFCKEKDKRHSGDLATINTVEHRQFLAYSLFSPALPSHVFCLALAFSVMLNASKVKAVVTIQLCTAFPLLYSCVQPVLYYKRNVILECSALNISKIIRLDIILLILATCPSTLAYFFSSWYSSFSLNFSRHSSRGRLEPGRG